jgi:hypothetical protein
MFSQSVVYEKPIRVARETRVSAAARFSKTSIDSAFSERLAGGEFQ